MKLSKGKHCVYALHYHIVLVTKYRRKVIDQEMMSYMKQQIGRIAILYNGLLHEMNGESDHIHILVELPPTVAVSSFVCVLKTQTSKEMRRHFFGRIKSKLWGNSFWTDSYFVATTGGANIDVLKRYIENQ